MSGGGKGGSAPTPPNYEAIIPVQAAEDRRTAQYTLDQMRVNQYSPYGSQTWERTPGTVNQERFTEAQANWERNGSRGPRPTESDFIEGQGWNYRQTLSPEQQELYDRGMESQLGQTELLNSATDRLQSTMETGLDTSGATSRGGPLQTQPTQQPGSYGRLGNSASSGVQPVGSAGTGFDQTRQNNVSQALYDQQMRFLQPEQQIADEQLRGQLIQSGFQEGSAGYERERNRLSQQQGLQRADARDRAILAGGAEDSRRFGQDLASSQYTQGLAGQQDQIEQGRFQTNMGAGIQEWGQGLAANNQNFNQNLQAGGYNQNLRDNEIREMMLLRQQPLNELNALRTGAQVNLPNNPAQYGSPQLPSQDYLGAAQQTYNNQMGQYNASQSSSNALMGGLFSLGGAALGNPAFGTALGTLFGGGG